MLTVIVVSLLLSSGVWGFSVKEPDLKELRQFVFQEVQQQYEKLQQQVNANISEIIEEYGRLTGN